MFEQDYIMRLIREMVRVISKIIFHKQKTDEEKPDLQDIGAAKRYERLLMLVNAGNINEAENLLYEELDTSSMDELQSAIFFYSYLNELDNETLEKADFSREEIKEGLLNILHTFGYGGLADTLIS